MIGITELDSKNGVSSLEGDRNVKVVFAGGASYIINTHTVIDI